MISLTIMGLTLSVINAIVGRMSKTAS